MKFKKEEQKLSQDNINKSINKFKNNINSIELLNNKEANISNINKNININNDTNSFSSNYLNTIYKQIKLDKTALSFKEFNLLNEVYNVLEKLDIYAPTSIQSSSIPNIMSKDNHIFYASNTGMGKTLSYLLPIINELKREEILSRNQTNKNNLNSDNDIILTKEKRPRALIIVPTRELAQQVEEVAKLFIYDVPLKIKSLYVGQKFLNEKRFLTENNGVDILISTPQRFKKHWSKKNVFFTNVRYLVIDELDTLLDSGHEIYLRELVLVFLKKNLTNVFKDYFYYFDNKNNYKENQLDISNYSIKFNNFFEIRRVIMVSTTLTNAIDVWLSNLFNPNLIKSNLLEYFPEYKSIIEELDNMYSNNKNNININLQDYNDSYNLSTKKQELYNIINKEYTLKKIIDRSTNHNLSNVKHQFIHVTDYNKLPVLLNIINDKYKYCKDNIIIDNPSKDYELYNQLNEKDTYSKLEKQAMYTKNNSMIIFCNSINCVRKVQYFLETNGFPSCAIHGDIPPFKRQNELYLFKCKQKRILVCTDIIARGLDFPFVFYVINFDFPISLSDYVHRAGRTGRAGKEGLCISLFRKFNIKVIDEIKESQSTKTPLNINNSVFNYKNKEDISTDNKNNKKNVNKVVNNSNSISFKDFEYKKNNNSSNNMDNKNNEKQNSNNILIKGKRDYIKLRPNKQTSEKQNIINKRQVKKTQEFKKKKQRQLELKHKAIVLKNKLRQEKTTKNKFI